MTGVFAGLIVALAAGAPPDYNAARGRVARGLHLVSLALGVTPSPFAAQTDLLHVLFGSVVGPDDAALLLLVGVSTVTLILLAVSRALVLGYARSSVLVATSALGEFTPFLSSPWWYSIVAGFSCARYADGRRA
jgi:zinc/manganese transport system permease protein